MGWDRGLLVVFWALPDRSALRLGMRMRAVASTLLVGELTEGLHGGCCVMDSCDWRPVFGRSGKEWKDAAYGDDVCKRCSEIGASKSGGPAPQSASRPKLSIQLYSKRYNLLYCQINQDMGSL